MMLTVMLILFAVDILVDATMLFDAFFFGGGDWLEKRELQILQLSDS